MGERSYANQSLVVNYTEDQNDMNSFFNYRSEKDPKEVEEN